MTLHPQKATRSFPRSAKMPKAIYRPEHDVLVHLLKDIRIRAGLKQAQCSKALGRSQSFMSDVENGIRRLDLVQLRDLCAVLGYDLPRLIEEYEEALKQLDIE